MSRFLYKLERKFGRYSVPNLTLIMIACYVVGVIIELRFPTVIEWISLNPYLILHGQVWRIITWVLIPPNMGISIWTLIALFFYYSIGRSLESTWGDFRYNVYIFSGLIFTVIGAFIVYGFAYLQFYGDISRGVITAKELFAVSGGDIDNLIHLVIPGYWFTEISTYYICMSIFLAYAATFPEMKVLLFMIIPVRVKILGIIDALYLGGEIIYSLITGRWYMVIIILMSLLNFLIFFCSTRNVFNLAGMSNYSRRANYRKKIRYAQMNSGHESVSNGKTVITKHKCAICGRTERDGELEFRFCSKCDGNYEYCSDHLYTHEHVKRI